MKLNKYIDHTLLKADATAEQIKKLCAEARQYDFASVCVNSCHVPLAKTELEGTDVKVCCVVGFPLGACFTEAKAYEAALSVERGAEEVDMVINIGAAKEGNWGLVEQDIKAVADACHPKAILKVIIETCLLTDEEKRKACLCAKRAGADFVKTSTGFSTSGATPEDVALMRETVGPHMGVKAAGGVRCTQDADEMISSGATRLGTSSGVKLMN